MNTAPPIKPGYMVGLSTRLRGGIVYHRQKLEHLNRSDGSEYERVLSEREIADKAEYEEGVRVRGKIRSLIAGACIWTQFSVLICPDDQLAQLDAAEKEAEALRDAYNASAQHCRVEFFCLRGRMADSAKDAARAIQAEMGELLGMLKEATAAGDVKNIRDVAAKATNIGKLLEQDTAAKTAADRAVQTARKVARMITREVEKGAGNVADVLSKANLAAIDTARFAFAATDEEGANVIETALDEQRFAGVEAESPKDPFIDGWVSPEDPADVAARIARFDEAQWAEEGA